MLIIIQQKKKWMLNLQILWPMSIPNYDLWASLMDVKSLNLQISQQYYDLWASLISQSNLQFTKVIDYYYYYFFIQDRISILTKSKCTCV